MVGTATYGTSRPDVCSAFPGRPGCPNVGFTYQLNTSSFSSGKHTISACATDSDATPDTGCMSLGVTNNFAPPAVYIDGPSAGQALSGMTTVRGWALDNATSVGTAIGSVQILVDGRFWGSTATYGTNWPDVCAPVYTGRPGCPNVGFAYPLNLTSLSAGPHTITVSAANSDSDAPSGDCQRSRHGGQCAS